VQARAHSASEKSGSIILTPREPVKIPQQVLDSLIEPEFHGYPFPVFEVPLEKLTTPGQPLPYIIRVIMRYLFQEEAILAEGLFRIPGSTEDMQMYRKLFDEGKEVVFAKSSYHDAAGLLKDFFRKLPEPLIPYIYDHQVKSLLEEYKAKEIEEQQFLASMKSTLVQLPTENLCIFKILMQFCYLVVSNSDVNMMTADNIVKCIVPSIGCIPAIFTYTLNHFEYFFVDSANTTTVPTIEITSNSDVDKRGRKVGKYNRHHGHNNKAHPADPSTPTIIVVDSEFDPPTKLLPAIPENSVVEISTVVI